MTPQHQKRNIALLPLALLLLAPTASGADFIETFADDSNGQAEPIGPWYGDFTCAGGGCTTPAFGGGIDGGMFHPAGTTQTFSDFSLNSPLGVTFGVDIVCQNPGTDTSQVSIRDTVGANHITVSFQRQGIGCQITISGGDDASVSFTVAETINPGEGEGYGVNLQFDWSQNEVDVYYDGNLHTANWEMGSEIDLVGEVVDHGTEDFRFLGYSILYSSIDGSTCFGGTQTCSWTDGNFDGLLANFTVPEAPAGLHGLVTQAMEIPTPPNGEIELRWPLSDNDPDPAVGNFTYRIYLDGVNIGDDTVTGQDGDGERFNLVVYSSSSNSSVVFRVDAINSTTGFHSDLSCSINIDPTLLLDDDACGTSTTGGNTTGHTTAVDTAAGLRGFCAALFGDSVGSLFLCGLVFIITIIAVMVGILRAFNVNGPALFIVPLTLAAAMAIFNTLALIWPLIAMILMIAACAAGVVAGIRKGIFGAA